eukprot:3656223-Pyramimonas_sp.AAC.1
MVCRAPVVCFLGLPCCCGLSCCCAGPCCCGMSIKRAGRSENESRFTTAAHTYLLVHGLPGGPQDRPSTPQEVFHHLHHRHHHSLLGPNLSLLQEGRTSLDRVRPRGRQNTRARFMWWALLAF